MGKTGTSTAYHNTKKRTYETHTKRLQILYITVCKKNVCSKFTHCSHTKN